MTDYSSVMSGDGSRVAQIGRQLEHYLAPDFVSYRTGEGGRKLAYVEGYEVMGLLNKIFEWDGW